MRLFNQPPASWRKTFFLIWSGQAFSLFGSELVQFSLVWYLTEQTGSASVLALASFAALIPRVLIGPVIGALVDKWDRQIILIVADAAIAIVTGFLIAGFYFSDVKPWHIYLVMFLRSIGSGFHWPSMQASISLIVPKENLAKIAGLNQTLRGFLGIVSPVAAALLLETASITLVLWIDVITALVAVVPLLIVRIPQPEKPEREEKTPLSEIFKEIKAGFAYLVKWKGLFYLALAAAGLNFLIHPGFTFTPLLVTQHFGKGPLEYSLVESIFSLGVISGGILLSIWGGFKKNIHTTLSGILGLAGGTLLVAFAPSSNFLLAVVGMAVAGFMQPIANGPIFAIMQANVEPHLQGRLFSMLESMVTAMMPLSMLVAAPVSEWIGVRGWLFVGGIGCLVIGIGGFFSRPLISIEEKYTHT